MEQEDHYSQDAGMTDEQRGVKVPRNDVEADSLGVPDDGSIEWAERQMPELRETARHAIEMFRANPNNKEAIDRATTAHDAAEKRHFDVLMRKARAGQEVEWKGLDLGNF